MIEKPLKQEIVEWKQHKVTKYLIQQLKDDMKVIQETWTHGGFTTESESGTIQLNSRALGNIKALGELLDYIEQDMGVEAMIDYEH